MKVLYPSIGLKRLCRLFCKTSQAFYDYMWRQSDEEMQEPLIIELVKSICSLLPNTGCVKLLHLLSDNFVAQYITIGRDSFFNLLKKQHLLVKRKKRYAITTWSNHPYHKWSDLVKGIRLSAPKQL